MSTNITVGLLDGTDGQAKVFREALAKAFRASPYIDLRLLTTDQAVDLAGVDLLFVFPNDWETAVSSYQEEWADRAKADGVKLFVPFEFGNPLGRHDGDPPVIHTIYNVLEHCRSIKLGVCRVHTGPAMDVILPGILRIDPESRIAQVVGRGDTPISFVTTSDVAQVITRRLLQVQDASLESLEGKTISVKGSPATYNQVLDHVLTLEGKPINVETRALETVKSALPVDIGPQNFLDWLMACWEKGRAYVSGEDEDEGDDYSYVIVEDVLRVNIK